MAEAQPVVVDEAQETPQEGGDSKREMSTIVFPYQDLDEGIEVAKAIHQLHGSTCQVEQIAAHLGQSPTSSSFKMKISTAKIFGLVTTGQGGVTLTPLGSSICDSKQEKGARADAFLKVPLYNKIFEQFKTAVLPPPSGLEATMGSMGVAQKQRERARQVFQRSAQEAGFFQYGTDRLVMPVKSSAAAATPAPDPEPDGGDKKKEKTDEDRKHPLIEGLLQELPPSKSEWTTEDRKKWLEMASTIFNVIYKDSDDSRGSLRVVVEKNSVKQ
jgi:hypothetical protein